MFIHLFYADLFGCVTSYNLNGYVHPFVLCFFLQASITLFLVNISVLYFICLPFYVRVRCLLVSKSMFKFFCAPFFDFLVSYNMAINQKWRNWQLFVPIFVLGNCQNLFVPSFHGMNHWILHYQNCKQINHLIRNYQVNNKR